MLNITTADDHDVEMIHNQNNWDRSANSIEPLSIGHVAMGAITETINLVPYHLVMSLQPILDKISNFQQNYSDLTRMRGYRNSSPNNG